MAVKASITVTISKYRDCDSITRYFKLQASTVAAPAIPTTLTPSSSDWSTTEPTYTSGSTNTLYYTDKYVFSDGTFQYTDDGNGKAIKSSSYEAAKEAYNKAQAAQNTANATQENLDNLEVGGRNYIEGTSNEWQSFELTDILNKTIYPNKVTDMSIKGLMPGDILRLSMYIKFSDDIIATGTGTKLSCIQANRNYGGESGWKSLPITGGSMVSRLEEIIASDSKEGLVQTYIRLPDDFNDGTYNEHFMIGFRFDYYTGTFYIKNFMACKGDKYLDWTPAPEDIQSELNTSIINLNTNINSRIDDTEGMISDLSDVVDTKIDADDADLIAQNKLDSFLDSAAWLNVAALEGAIQALTNSDDGTYQILEQKDGEWAFQLGKLFTDVKTAVEDLTKTKDQLDGSEESALSKRIDQLDEDTKYIKMTTYEGQPAIILGMENSPFQVRITNTAMEFVESGNVIAYVNNGAFYNTVGIVREEIKIVNHNQGFSWKTRANGNLGLQWVEET